MLNETQDHEQTVDTEIELVERPTEQISLELGTTSEQPNLTLNEVVVRQDIPPHLRNLRGGGGCEECCLGVCCSFFLIILPSIS
jgi:hypothetical protein